MAKRKKRKVRQRKPAETSEAQDPFNPAFQRRMPLKQAEPEVLNGKTSAVSEDDHVPSDLFFEAMAGVAPLKNARSKVPRKPSSGIKPPHPARDDAMEVVAHLSDLVAGNSEMDITFSDEYMEGSVHGLDPRLMRELKKGFFPYQDHLDLHGLTRQEAESRLREFLVAARALGKRCVLVVHGRGRNSDNKISVLKENLPLWLSTGALRRLVLAFCTARPYDGGAGAVYILLRKNRGQVGKFNMERNQP